MLKWLREYWWVALLAAGSAVLWVFQLSKEKPTDTWKIEAKAAKAGHEANEMKIRQGSGIARAKVNADYKKELESLDEKQKKQAGRLAADPAALSRFLVRVSARK